MTYYNKKSKCWVARWQINGVRKSRSGFTRKKYAEMFESQQKLDHEKGLVGIETIPALKIEDVFLQYLKVVEDYQRKNTTRMDRAKLKAWLEFLQMNRVFYLSEISTDLPDKFFEAQKKKGLKTSTAQSYITFLRKVLNFLVEKEVIKKSPIEKWPKFKNSKQEKIPRYLSVDELGLLEEIAYRRKKIWGDVIAVLSRTGIRIGELCSLEKHNVDFDRNSIIIEGKKAKSGYQRIVPMGSQVKKILTEYFDKCDKYIFSNRAEKIIPETVYSLVKSLYSDLGIEDANVHTLRKTFISHAIMSGEDPVRIMAIVGHRNWDVMRSYLALSPRYILEPPKLPF